MSWPGPKPPAELPPELTEQRVVGLHGNTVHDLPERSEVVVRELEKLLARAEAGEVIGLAFATWDRDMSTTAGILGRISAQLAGRAFTLAVELARKYEDEG